MFGWEEKKQQQQKAKTMSFSITHKHTHIESLYEGTKTFIEKH